MANTTGKIAATQAAAAKKAATAQAKQVKQAAAVAARSAKVIAKDDKAIGKFNSHISNEIAKAGGKAFTTGFQTKINSEESAFAKHHTRFTPVAANTLIPTAPDGTGALVLTVTNPIDPLASGVNSGPVASGGGVSTFSAGSIDTSDATGAGVTAPAKSGGIPTWLLITGGVVGAIGIYGYVKYKAVTAPFKAILGGVNGITGNARAIGAGIRKLKGG